MTETPVVDKVGHFASITFFFPMWNERAASLSSRFVRKTSLEGLSG
jgi:hypothetical protein